jgi:hypothetical protein
MDNLPITNKDLEGVLDDYFTPLIPYLVENGFEEVNGKRKCTYLIFYIPEGILQTEIDFDKIKELGFTNLEIKCDYRNFPIPGMGFKEPEPILLGKYYTISNRRLQNNRNDLLDAAAYSMLLVPKNK